MGKSINKTQYVQKYRKEWELDVLFKGWLTEVPGDSQSARCKICKYNFTAHKKTLNDHLNSIKHKKAIKHDEIIVNSQKIDNFIRPTIVDERKIVELRIAAFIAKNCSIRTVDELSLLIKNLDKSSKILSDIKLHRTKCTSLVLNVIAPCMLQELIEDIGDSHYSAIIDESTAIDKKKIMCIMIRYFSKSKRKIKISFFKLVLIESGDAASLYEAFTNSIEDSGLNLKNLIGIGVDGANAMVGAHNSLASRLTALIPYLVVVKCVCHSLHLAAEESFKLLPKHIDFLIKESYNWFSFSSKRQIEYQELYKAMTKNKKEPTKIARLSGTRWLARISALSTILEQWEQLKQHFKISKDNERSYTAEQLYNMLEDDKNFIYLTFLKVYLKKITSLNEVFQKDQVECLKLFEDLNDLLYNILQVIVVPQQLAKMNKKDLSGYNFQEHLMSINHMNFGYAVTKACDDAHIKAIKHLTDKQQKNLVSQKFNNEIFGMKERFKLFLITLCCEIQKRVPKNLDILQTMSLFSAIDMNMTFPRDISGIASIFEKISGGTVDDIINEWNHVHRISTGTKTTEEFWAEISQMTTASGDLRFSHISKLATSLLSLPFSNASVERSFSIMNIVKDKLRNKMSVKTAEAILRVKDNVPKSTLFEPTKEMLKKFCSSEMYNSEVDEVVIDALSEL